MTAPVAALFVRADGPYPGLVSEWYGSPGKDARDYAGPLPVVAHPPCARWGRFWWSDGSATPGSDDGCFSSAIEAVRRWGGVLEHPETSHAWPRFGILKPSWGAWSRSLYRPDEWVTSVDQVAYGHRARKRTWLVCVGDPVPLRWDRWDRGAPQLAYIVVPGRVWRQRRTYIASGPGISRTAELRRIHGIELMGKRERELTPLPFAELLVSIAVRSHGRAQPTREPSANLPKTYSQGEKQPKRSSGSG